MKLVNSALSILIVECVLAVYITVGYGVDDVAASGGCACSTDSPQTVTCTDYVASAYTERLEETEDEISRLGRLLTEYNDTLIDLHRHVEIVESQLNVTQETLEGVLAGTVVITVSELVLVEEELTEMSLVLYRVEQTASDVPEVQLLREELDNFTRAINDLKLSSPTEVRVLRRKIDELKVKLAECEKYDESESEDDDSLFQPWNDFPSQDSCHDLIHVSEPFTVRGGGTQPGAWFRDPVLNYHMVWYAPFQHTRYSYQVDCFANVADFRRGTLYESRYLLPRQHAAQGPGMVAYNGSLYYHQDQTKNIIRYDITNSTVAATGLLPDAVINNQGSYTPEGHTDIDLAVDELGLWAIYTHSRGNTNTGISRLNPETLDIIETWVAPFQKSRAGNCFMICAKVYCISNHFSHDAKVNLVYDTATNEFLELQVPFDVRFGAMRSLDYNPRDQKLYGWDDGHQVLYDLTFDPSETEVDPSPPVLLTGDYARLDLH